MRESSRRNRHVYQPGDRIADFTVIRMIGQGGYGDIYSVTNDNFANTYAMKLESLRSPKKGLDTEAAFLERLQDSRLFPQLLEHGETASDKYLVMELLGPSLSNTRRQAEHRRLSLATVIRMGIFMLECIEDFHRHGLIHCDIKPGNFLLRCGFRNPLALIDFGLSKARVNSATGALIPERRKVDFHGTFKYASVPAQEYRDQCPRDDLISWVYSMVELVEGALPWGNVLDKNRIKAMKKGIAPRELLRSFPDEFQAVFRYASGLRFGSAPNYEYMRQLLLQALSGVTDAPCARFDWELFPQKLIEEYSPVPRLPAADEVELPERQELAPTVEEEFCRARCTCLIL